MYSVGTHTTKEGLSILELLVSIAIITALASLSFTSFAGFFNTHSVDKEAGVVIATIAYARSQSMSGKGDSAYGVHFASDGITVFLGTTYNSSAASNVVRQFASGVQISNIAIGSGVSDVVFAKLTGASSATGTITIASAKDSSRIKIITISATGLAE
jgi:Tfp pilus assembly protein FimT